MLKRLALFLTGMFSMVLLLEVGFRFLPVSTATDTGYHVHPRILTYPPFHRFTLATGWDLKNPQVHVANNYGFLAGRAFAYEPAAIALIGDSFVEANMLPLERRLASQLESRLAGRPVYAMGGPGSSLLDYAERAEFAARQFGIRRFLIVLERGDIRQALCGSGNVHGPCMDPVSVRQQVELQPAPGLFKRVARESALAQYVFSQLKFSSAKFFESLIRFPNVDQAPIGGTAQPAATVFEPVIRAFFERLATIDGGSFVLVIDADRGNFQGGRPATFPELGLFAEIAKAHGAIVVDPTARFRNFVSKTSKILEVGPYDRHWNPDAVQLVAADIAEQVPADWR